MTSNDLSGSTETWGTDRRPARSSSPGRGAWNRCCSASPTISANGASCRNSPPHLTRLTPEQVLRAYREACYRIRAYYGEDPFLDQVPRDVDELLEWVGLMEAAYPVQLLRHLVYWARCRDLPGRMKDWDADQVARGHAECLRRLAEPPREPGCDDEPDPRT